MQAEHLGNTFAQERAIIRPRPKATDINTPKIECWLAFDQPFGQIFPGAASAGDSDGIKTGGNEKIFQFRRFTKNRA
jgi:hypothetical protein